jgi:hypothetical protein
MRLAGSATTMTIHRGPRQGSLPVEVGKEKFLVFCPGSTSPQKLITRSNLRACCASFLLAVPRVSFRFIERQEARTVTEGGDYAPPVALRATRCPYAIPEALRGPQDHGQPSLANLAGPPTRGEWALWGRQAKLGSA